MLTGQASRHWLHPDCSCLSTACDLVILEVLYRATCHLISSMGCWEIVYVLKSWHVSIYLLTWDCTKCIRHMPVQRQRLSQSESRPITWLISSHPIGFSNRFPTKDQIEPRRCGLRHGADKPWGCMWGTERVTGIRKAGNKDFCMLTQRNTRIQLKTSQQC